MSKSFKHKSRASSSNNNHKQWMSDITNGLEIIPDRLYFTMSKCPRNTDKIHMFSIDHALRYEPFFVDFGPLNLACLYKFCKLLCHKLAEKKYKNHVIYYYCDRTPQRISNAAYLMGCYQVIELGRDPHESYKRVKSISEKGIPFRDASMGLCTYHCTVRHCIHAIYNALNLGWIDFNTFNVDEYEHYERVECGDLNVIVPNKFIAFAGPYYKEFDEEGYPALTPDFYLPIFKQKFKVKSIVRLNKKCYDKRIFTNAGFTHHDMYFVDGTTPNESIMSNFLNCCEKERGVLAVHCKAGLGRTGSCIGCYMMKHYAFNAHECIAWMRICRPGSVIGPQQMFLEDQQHKMWKSGDLYRKKNNISLKFDPRIQANHRHNHRNHKSNNNENDSNEQKSQNNHGRNKIKMDDKDCKDDDGDMNMGNEQNSNNNQKNSKPLATDPGQNQGAALKDAKRKHHFHSSNN